MSEMGGQEDHDPQYQSHVISMGHTNNRSTSNIDPPTI